MTTGNAGDVPDQAVEIDPALVAPGLGLDVPAFRELMADRRISTLCERGTGPDAGLIRGTFYHSGRRVRLVVDAAGRPVEPPVADDVAVAARAGR